MCDIIPLVLYNYHYDQLNRIAAMDVYNGLNPIAGTFTPVSISDYAERISYDPNGNILTYQRNGDAARTSMDNLSYFYKANTNQLHKVSDAAPDVAPADYSKYNDLKQGQLDNNYQYDAIGNLVSDASEGITNINWNVYGKIMNITKSGAQIGYLYDASGNRIIKQTASDTTVYVRDARGNVLSVYEKKPGGQLVQTEMDLYGSSRLGMAVQHLALDTTIVLSGGFGTAIKSSFTRGEKVYELNNHLGNVLVTVSDKKLGVDQNSDGVIDYYTADVLTATDTYPFGMQMPGRTFRANGLSYRYGFNGKENDNEVKGEGNEYDYGARIYDTRLGRWFSGDIKERKYPNYSPYVYSANSPNAILDADGEDWIVSTSTDKKTGVTTISITINAKIENGSSKTIDMKKLIQNIKAKVERDYSGSDPSQKLAWKTTLNLEEYKVDKNQNSNLKSTDHFMEILDGSHFNSKTTAGYSQLGGLYIGLNADYFDGKGSIGQINIGNGMTVNNRSLISHELGHTGGLVHPWEIEEDNLNLNTVNGKKMEIPGQIAEDNAGYNLYLTFMGYATKPPDIPGYPIDPNIPKDRPNPATVNQIKDIKLNFEKGKLNGNNTGTSSGHVIRKRYESRNGHE